MPLRSSPAAEFQALNTRARLGAQLWGRTAGFVLLVWIALTFWVIWYRVGLYRPEIHHEYFGRWILGGIVADTPLVSRLAPRIPMPLNHQWYDLPAFMRWIDGPEMYRDSFYEWYWHMATGLGGYYGLGTDLFPISVTALLIAWRWRRDPEAADHIRGATLMNARQFDRALWRSR